MSGPDGGGVRYYPLVTDKRAVFFWRATRMIHLFRYNSQIPTECDRWRVSRQCPVKSAIVYINGTRSATPTCTASSRVGTSTTAKVPSARLILGCLAARLWTMGARYASVFPEPVGERTNASRPLISTGMLCFWTCGENSTQE
jgi:hypothetical protein